MALHAELLRPCEVAVTQVAIGRIVAAGSGQQGIEPQKRQLMIEKALLGMHCSELVNRGLGIVEISLSRSVQATLRPEPWWSNRD